MDSDVSGRTRAYSCAFKVACHYRSGGAFAAIHKRPICGNQLVHPGGNEQKLKEFLQRPERLAFP
jgi:hypothetical protein